MICFNFTREDKVEILELNINKIDTWSLKTDAAYSARGVALLSHLNAVIASLESAPRLSRSLRGAVPQEGFPTTELASHRPGRPQPVPTTLFSATV